MVGRAPRRNRRPRVGGRERSIEAWTRRPPSTRPGTTTSFGEKVGSNHAERDSRRELWPVAVGDAPPRDKDVTGTAIKASTSSSAHLSRREAQRAGTMAKRDDGVGRTRERRACVNTLNLVRDCRGTERAPSVSHPLIPPLFPFLVACDSGWRADSLADISVSSRSFPSRISWLLTATPIQPGKRGAK